MKNIHLIPTDKPSRLYEFGGSYSLQPKAQENFRNYHIYITSDEEIKEGVNQWYLDKNINKPYNSGGAQYSNKQNVIILTTDQDLIADGVRAIDDDFLQWFVKNPSCEFVETHIVEICTYCGRQYCDNIDCRGYNDKPKYLISFPENTTQRIITYCDGYEVYTKEIIIPQEEPKQCKCGSNWVNTTNKDNPFCFHCGKPLTQEAKQRAANYMALKGALDTQYVDFSNPNADKISSASTASFKQERSYSEEDMIAFLDWSKSTNQEKSEYELKCLLAGVVIDSKTLFNKWFEQHKKK